MPEYAGKSYPYTPEGIAAYEKAKAEGEAVSQLSRRRLPGPIGYGEGKVRPREGRARIEEGELPFTPAPPSISEQVRPPLGDAPGSDLNRPYGKSAHYFQGGTPTRFMQNYGRTDAPEGTVFPGSVDASFLDKHTTGPITDEQDVLRQIREHEGKTYDPLVEIIQQQLQYLLDEELAAQGAHDESTRSPVPLESGAKDRDDTSRDWPRTGSDRPVFRRHPTGRR
jgi:hypothetical protein